MLHCCVWGSKRRTSSSSVVPDARSRVTSSICPSPPSILRATDVPPNSSQDVDPFSHSRSTRCLHLQEPMKKSKSARPSCSCCLKVDSLMIVPPRVEAALVAATSLPPPTKCCHFLLQDTGKCGQDWASFGHCGHFTIPCPVPALAPESLPPPPSWRRHNVAYTSSPAAPVLASCVRKADDHRRGRAASCGTAACGLFRNSPARRHAG